MIDLYSEGRKRLEAKLERIRIIIVFCVLVGSFWLMGAVLCFFWGVSLLVDSSGGYQFLGFLFVFFSPVAILFYFRLFSLLGEKFGKKVADLDYILPEEREKWIKILQKI